MRHEPIHLVFAQLEMQYGRTYVKEKMLEHLKMNKMAERLLEDNKQ